MIAQRTKGCSVPSLCSFWAETVLISPGWFPKALGASYLLFTHPVVHLLRVTVEELQVHALLILLSAQLPELQQGGSLLGQDGQLAGQGAKSASTLELGQGLLTLS